MSGSVLVPACLLIVFSTGWTPLTSFAQTSVDIGLERDVNRYRWTAGFDSDLDAGQWKIRVRDSFSSDAYVLFSNSYLLRDENRLGWSASRPVSDRVTLRVVGDSDWFSLSRVFIHSTLGGFSYKVNNNFAVTPLLGFALDQRPGVSEVNTAAPLRADVGPAIGLMSRYRGSADNNAYSFDVSGMGNVQRISPRRGHQYRLTGLAAREQDGANFSARFIASTVRRDTYQAVSFLNRDLDTGNSFSESIEQTASDTLGIIVDATMPIGRTYRLSASGDLTANGRTIKNTGAPDETLFFDTQYDRRSFDFQGAIVRETQASRIEIASTAGVEEESRSLTNRDELPEIQATQKSNLLRQADYDRGYFSLATSFRGQMGRRYTVTMSGTARILNHNTPETNPDDRDEVSFTSRAGLQVRVSDALRTDLTFYGTRYETVYLKSERSAENNVQRSIRFNPSIVWNPSVATTVRLSSEVRATYSVDQFTLPGRRPRDQSAREMRYELDGRRTIADQFAVLVSTSYSTLHLGRFLEDSFAEIPFDTLQIKRAWVRLQAGRTFLADVGVRTLIRSDYNQSLSVAYQPVDESGIPLVDVEGNPVKATIIRPGRNIIEQLGPTASLVWPMNNRSSLRLDGWLIFQRVYQNLYGVLPDGNASVIREAAKNGRMSTIPNLTMTIRWIL
ncbi:MAG: hypothetical protein HKN43_10500 [Rhodothermales bacterium]|nr:hypothetical protein [Rhodothermales bacterium]